MSIKTERLGNILLEEIGKIIHYEIDDNDAKLVTITSVNITSDLSFAKVYFTTLGNKKETIKMLNNASRYIKVLLSKRVIIRKMPELTFVYDDSVEYGQKIENIIERINENE